MNLFVTDENPILCAQALDDKRIGKLLMEANQMLSLAVKIPSRKDGRLSRAFSPEDIGPGKLCAGFAHLNHPVSLWVRETYGNFLWAMSHAIALAGEFQHRFGKSHASDARTDYISRFSDNVAPGSRTAFQNSARNASLGIDYSWILPVTEAYREYLNSRWRTDVRPPKWTNREKPEWENL